MRADRLVAVLLLLQQRGRVTAREVADELEVSERTARRDLEALGMAGIPVYSVRGRGGGWGLAGRGRTDLSGLTADEASALFALTAPRATDPAVRAALRKLTEALPEPLRARALAAAGAVIVDPSGWDRAEVIDEPVHLEALRRAVVESERVRLAYRDRSGTGSRRVVDPLGLAAKGSTWYLIAGTERGRRTFRVDRVEAVDPTGQPTERPDDFDLAATWAEIVDAVDELRTPVHARALVDREALAYLRYVFGTRVAEAGTPPLGEDAGRVEVVLRGQHIRSLAAELASFGDSLEVLEPRDLRLALGEIGRRLVTAYGTR